MTKKTIKYIFYFSLSVLLTTILSLTRTAMGNISTFILFEILFLFSFSTIFLFNKNNFLSLMLTLILIYSTMIGEYVVFIGTRERNFSNIFKNPTFGIIMGVIFWVTIVITSVIVFINRKNRSGFFKISLRTLIKITVLMLFKYGVTTILIVLFYSTNIFNLNLWLLISVLVIETISLTGCFITADIILR